MIRIILIVMQLILYIPATRGPGNTTFDGVCLLKPIRYLLLLNLFQKPKKIQLLGLVTDSYDSHKKTKSES